ncbi:hypothetical protein FO519_010007, partial [Halicephalobus sp. NKZ332]
DRAVIKECVRRNETATVIVSSHPEFGWGRQGVQRIIEKIKASDGDYTPGKSSGRPKTAMTEEILEEIRRIHAHHEANRIPLSLRILGMQLGISKTSAGRILKKLGLKPLRKVYGQHLTRTQKRKRRERCRKLLHRFRARGSEEDIIFSDEKIFTLSHGGFKQLERIYVDKNIPKRDVDPERLTMPRVQNPKKLMVWCAFSAKGPVHMEIFDEGERLNGERYRRIFIDWRFRQRARQLHNGRYILQQDGATCHTANATRALFRELNIKFIDKDEWPPKSPDLTPLDYRLWSWMLHRISNASHSPSTLKGFTLRRRKRSL